MDNIVQKYVKMIGYGGSATTTHVCKMYLAFTAFSLFKAISIT